MKTRYLLPLLLSLTMVASACEYLPTTLSATPTPTTAEALQSALGSIVRVVAQDSEGTGFVAYQAGQIVTAYHVVGSPDARVTIIAADGSEHRAIVLGVDQEKDLALLIAPTLERQPIPLGEVASEGDAVYAVGYAAGFSGDASITRGIVSALRVDSETGITYVQTDASLNPGNSGGPLFDVRGHVIGVNLVRLRGELAEFEGLGFALSAEELRLAQAFLQAGRVRVLHTPTAVPTPYVTRIPTREPRIVEWCAFLDRVFEFSEAHNAHIEQWNARNRQERPVTDAERRKFKSDFDEVWDLACSLPRRPSEARPIADRLCSSAESWTSYLARGGGIAHDHLRLQANRYRQEASDMFDDVHRMLGSPRCP